MAWYFLGIVGSRFDERRYFFHSPNHNQRDGGRRFYLAIPGRDLPAPEVSHQDIRHAATECDETRSQSLRSDSSGETHEQVARLRHEGRQVDSSAGAR